VVYLPELKDPPKLPENLSDQCLTLLEELKAMAAKTTQDKAKLFTPDFNETLLK